MFRFLNGRKLSSSSQKAEVFFYRGANAEEMLSRFRHDSNLKNVDLCQVERFFILTGSNNVDDIMYDDSGWQFHKATEDIRRMLLFLHHLAPQASINVINILPRHSLYRNSVINRLNEFLHSISAEYNYINLINTEYNNRCLFSTVDGYRREFYFRAPTKYIPDNVHLNDKGVERLGKHLKYLAHNC